MNGSSPVSNIILGEYWNVVAEQWMECDNQLTERRYLYNVQLDKWSINHSCRHTSLRNLAWRPRSAKLRRLNICVFVFKWLTTCRSCQLGAIDTMIPLVQSLHGLSPRSACCCNIDFGNFQSISVSHSHALDTTTTAICESQEIYLKCYTVRRSDTSSFVAKEVWLDCLRCVIF